MLLGCEGGIKWFSFRKKNPAFIILIEPVFWIVKTPSLPLISRTAEVFGFAVFSAVCIASALRICISMVGGGRSPTTFNTSKVFMLLLTFTALEDKSLLLLQTRALVVFPLACSHGFLVFPFHHQQWDLIIFLVLCFICEIALFPIFLFSHALKSLYPWIFTCLLVTGFLILSPN